jgi:fatty acid desaturase
MMESGTAPLVLTDPIYRPRPLRALERIIAAIVHDPRDLPFVWLIAAVSATVVPAAVLLMIEPNFSWWAASAYLLVVIGVCQARFLAMYHHIAHRPLFTRRAAFLKQYVNWILGPLFGVPPNGYYAHHILMHHVENNHEGDLSSTMRYQRDSFRDFLRYFFDVFSGAYYHLPVSLLRRKRYRLARYVFIGGCSYLVLISVVACFNWRAALVVYIIPWAVAMVGFCCTTWGAHAFIDPAAPDNIYRGAVICLNTLYNHVAFNDGYHIVHHVKPTLHWTEMPEEFLANRSTYAREDAIIFQKLDYQAIVFLLMTKRYDVLARHCVHLGTRRSEEETIAILRERTAKFTA